MTGHAVGIQMRTDHAVDNYLNRLIGGVEPWFL